MICIMKAPRRFSRGALFKSSHERDFFLLRFHLPAWGPRFGKTMERDVSRAAKDRRSQERREGKRGDCKNINQARTGATTFLVQLHQLCNPLYIVWFFFRLSFCFRAPFDRIRRARDPLRFSFSACARSESASELARANNRRAQMELPRKHI